MRFRKLIISNFGPFKDTETIDFTEENGVNIIWGDNGYGKTSTLNAFNFVLFNVVKDNHGNEVDYITYINRDGYKEGKYSYKVQIEIEAEGKAYRITRNLVPVQGVMVPKLPSDVRTVLSVSENGIIHDKETGEHILKTIITPEVARFFLFDGELLEEYEALLDEKSETGGSIKNAIEQILGLPVLTFGFADSKIALERISTAATKIAQNDANTRTYANSIEDYKAEKLAQEAERDRLVGEKERLLDQKKQIQVEIDNTQKLRNLVTKRNIVEGKIAFQQQEIERLKAEITELLKESWKWMISSTVSSVANTIAEKVEALREKEKGFQTQERMIAYIQAAIDEDVCPVCEHQNSTHERELLQEKLRSIRDGSAALSMEERDFLSTNRKRMNALRANAGVPDQSSLLKDKCTRINDLFVSIADIEGNELSSIKNEITALIESGGDEDAAADIMRRSEECGRELQIVEEGIKAQNDAIAELEKNIEKTTKKLIQVSNNRDVKLAGKKKDFATQVASIFEQGITAYREKLRKNVESDATEIFRAMNTETDYDRLSINDNYGLSIVLKSSGELAPRSSAGWIHMVAFALIGALHKNAPFEGPVIMDSPFGRMSAKNTANMVKALPLISSQVLLLPLPGEIDDQRTRQDIGMNIVQEKLLRRISATHSKVEEMSKHGN